MTGKLAVTLSIFCVLAVSCLCEENLFLRFLSRSSERAPSCEGRRLKTVSLHVLNVLKKPHMDNFITVRCSCQKYLLGIMKEAADEDPSFRFTATYYNHELGFYLDAYNGTSAHCNEDQMFWAILDGRLEPTHKGISSYEPMDGETVTFNVTACRYN